jgi:hypothetical protein
MTYQELKEKYKTFFENLSFGFEFGPGWIDLVDRLTEKILKIAKEKEIEVYATQVKEKYGTLRFYLSSETDEMSTLISEASNESRIICEICGKEGKLKLEVGWWQVRCLSCK